MIPNTEQMEQLSLLSEARPRTITIEQSANYFGVSTATIRNWIKTNYLEQLPNGQITRESLERFQFEVAGTEKLNQRANKTLRDSHDHKATVSSFLDRLARDPSRSDEIGIEYELSLSNSYRNREGIYYTPTTVTDDLFSMPGKNIGSASFFDPCCGSGNFIIRALELGFLPENIYGYDIDPVAVEITKARIYNATGYKSPNIKLADFLSEGIYQHGAKFDYVFTNPPWGKKLPRKERELIGNHLGSGASLDTCSLFFFGCINRLSPGGKLGLLLPESLFNVSAFESVRIELLQLSIERLVDYGKVFNGLLTRAQGVVIHNIPAVRQKPVRCEFTGSSYGRSIESFACNPKAIINFYSGPEDAKVIKRLMSTPHITLKGRASWGLGIVTGNNKRFFKAQPDPDDIPVFKGADISQDGLKEATHFIPSDLDLYQQVAPLRLYQAKEKLIYKFISSRLCFFYDDKQRFILNSANLLIPNDQFPVSIKLLSELLNSDFMNWIFARIFNTHKILRGDLEALPIHSQFLHGLSHFNESKYLAQLQIEKIENGAYRIKT